MMTRWGDGMGEPPPLSKTAIEQEEGGLLAETPDLKHCESEK